MLPALPNGDHVHIGRITQRVNNFERAGLLSLNAIRVDRIDEDDGRAIGQCADKFERDVEVSAHLQHMRAMHQRLCELSKGNMAFGDQHDTGHPGAPPHTQQQMRRYCRLTRTRRREHHFLPLSTWPSSSRGP